MGDQYRVPANGSNFGNLYGAAYTYSNRVYTALGVMGDGHQMVWCQNGTPTSAMGSHLWTSGNVYGNVFYDRNNTGYYVDPDNGGFTLRGGSSNRVTYYTNDSGFRVNNPEGNGTTDLRLGAAWGRPGVYSSSQLELMSDSTTGIIFIIDDTEYGRLNTDYFKHNSDIRAPLFYDNDNTAYYADPASTSRFNAIEADGFHAKDMGDYFTFYGDNSSNHSISSRSNGGGAADDIRINSYGAVYINLDSNNNDTSGADFRIGRHGGSASGINQMGLFDVYGDSLYVYSAYSFRSPYFYDSDNTAYLLNPANSSYMNVIYLDNGIFHNGDTNTYIQFHAADQWRVVTGGTERLEVNNSAITATVSITSSGNITAYSDIRLKENVQTIDNALNKVLSMRGVTFTKDGKDGLGVIAQEVEEVIPQVVLTADDEMQTKSVDYGNIVGLLIEAIKEQQEEIEALKNEITALKGFE
jgi:hypothetical protein